jgi:hypothetical protein
MCPLGVGCSGTVFGPAPPGVSYVTEGWRRGPFSAFWLFSGWSVVERWSLAGSRGAGRAVQAVSRPFAAFALFTAGSTGIIRCQRATSQPFVLR